QQRNLLQQQPRSLCCHDSAVLLIASLPISVAIVEPGCILFCFDFQFSDVAHCCYFCGYRTRLKIKDAELSTKLLAGQVYSNPGGAIAEEILQRQR
ncbi:hypothetical protein LINPERPRIM_LOCUS25900, partial [Linum perenne]